MDRSALTKPILICLYGFPGSGKSFVARNLAGSIPSVAHVSTDRIRVELFRRSRLNSQQQAATTRLAMYITNEFLRTGISVVYDANALTATQRHRLREIAAKHKAGYLLVWLQIDSASAFARAVSRDKRTAEGKYASEQTRVSYDEYLGGMENPKTEDYLALSGKHSFASQKSAIISRLHQMGLVDSSVLTEHVIKPGLVNLVPRLTTNPTSFERRDIPL